MKLRPKTTLERQDSLEGENLFFYNFSLTYTKNKKVLDAGTGYGFGADYIVKHGAKLVVGVDLEESAITFAKKAFKNSRLKFQVMDLTNIVFPRKSFSVVVAFDVIEHLPLDKHSFFLQTIKKLLVKEGILLLSTPNKYVSSPNQETPNNPYHLKEFTPKDLEKTVKKIFPETELFGVSIVNEEYNKKVDALSKSFKYKIFDFFGKFKLARDLISFTPKNFRRKISGSMRCARWA